MRNAFGRMSIIQGVVGNRVWSCSWPLLLFFQSAEKLLVPYCSYSYFAIVLKNISLICVTCSVFYQIQIFIVVGIIIFVMS